MNALIDLHTHSDRSDGRLAPAALVEHAAARGVGMLALTDHDTLAGHDEARAACAGRGIRFVPGVEVSATFRGQSIHVVGLDVEPAPLARLLANIIERRRERIAAVGERLTRRGRLPGAEIAAAVLDAHPVPTRTHLARELVARGHAETFQDAFDRWLGRGRDGNVPVTWPALPDVVETLAGAAGAVVLAHAHRYRLSGGALRQLVGEFREHGGDALEVSLAGMGPADRDRVASLARRHGLAGSIGSDFHDPATPWTPLGRSPLLPDGIAPIAERLGRPASAPAPASAPGAPVAAGGGVG